MNLRRPRKEAELNLGFTSAKAEPKQPEPEPEPEETIKTEDRAKIASAIPYQSIVDSYHARLPMCPRVTRISDQRKKMMKARWHSDLHDVDAWDAYFSSVSDSLFLTGRTNGTRSPFFAGFDWLLNESNMLKVQGGNYVNRTPEIFEASAWSGAA